MEETCRQPAELEATLHARKVRIGGMVRQSIYRNRRVTEIEDDNLLVTVCQQGGHIARLVHKRTGINPLWTPEWPSIEPSDYDAKQYPEYGDSNEARLLAGLLGHNICLDVFGAPSPSEAKAGIPLHGEAAYAPYEVRATEQNLTIETHLPAAQLQFVREIEIVPNGVLRIRETVTNLSATDRPIAWTQHVTLGAPFLEPGQTTFLLNATRSRVIGLEFNNGLGTQLSSADFEWPNCPRRDGEFDDLSLITSEAVTGGFTTHLMDPSSEHAYFVGWSPRYQLSVGYIWRRVDFPWLGRWEENHLRAWAPWNGNAFALGLEFGVSAFVESRREMVERHSMFGAPAFRWLEAKSSAHVEYCAFLQSAQSQPKSIHWDGKNLVELLF